MFIETTSIKNELFYDSLYVSCETYIYRIDLDYSIFILIYLNMFHVKHT